MARAGIGNLEYEATIGTGHQFVLVTRGEVNHNSCVALPVHANADVLDTALVDNDVILARSHHGVGKVDDDARRRIERRQLGRERALRLEFEAQPVLAVGYFEPLQLRARRRTFTRHVGRGGDQPERQQRNNQTQQLLSHFPISPWEATWPPCVSSKSLLFRPIRPGL